MGNICELKHSSWEIEGQFDQGGYGKIFNASSSDHPEAVAKFIPKDPGADRELLFVDLEGVSNVVPILDYGSTDESWVLIMPKAKYSLHQYLEDRELPLSISEAKVILTDIATTLVDLGKTPQPIVHRDVKPKNVLRLNGAWCLADFGISRYIEATTAAHTLKEVFSQSYAAPELWNLQRPSAKTDIYALGVIAYYILSGRMPFPGPTRDDYREQHLLRTPNTLSDLPPALASLLAQCLYKAPEARPSASDFLERLSRIDGTPSSKGRAKLQQASLAEVARNALLESKEFEQATEQKRRSLLGQAAKDSYKAISDGLRQAIKDEAPGIRLRVDNAGGWSAEIGRTTLDFSPLNTHGGDEWNGWKLGFDVVAYGSISLELAPNNLGYRGRSHSLWYCDPITKGEYAWYEVGFMDHALMRKQSTSYPFALPPGEKSAKALAGGMTEFDIGRRFVRLIPGDIGDFVDFWLGILGDAASGEVPHPQSMPDGERGSWRRA